MNFEKFMAKTLLQMFRCIINHLPCQPIEFRLYYAMKTTGIPLSRPREFTVSIREGSNTDIDALVSCIDKRDRFLDRLNMSDHCLIAIDKGEIVDFLWFSDRSDNREEQTGYLILINNESVYSYDSCVSPDFRRQGISTQLKTFLLEKIKQQGKDTIANLSPVITRFP